MWDVTNKDYGTASNEQASENTRMTREAIRKMRALLVGQVQDKLYVVAINENVELLTKPEMMEKYPEIGDVDKFIPLKVGSLSIVNCKITVLRIK